MKQFLFLLAAGFVALFILTARAQSAQTANENWTDVNLAVTDNQVIPAYAAFAGAAGGLEEAGAAFCAAPDEAAFDRFRAAYHDGLDAWEEIQHVQFGPITYFNWNYRLQYWPDDKGTGARQLTALIAAQNPDRLKGDAFARESVGVQGFPALERLLFADDSLADLQADAYRCQVARTIARNISEIASGVHDRWVNEFRTTVANADNRELFEDARDATIEFLKAQVDPVDSIQVQKVEAAIGDEPGQERVRRAESWRSARSLRNIKHNLDALQAMFQGVDGQANHLGSVLLPDDEAAIDDHFVLVQNALADLPDSFAAALALDGGHARLSALAVELDALHEAMETALKNTDMYLGFNSLDGD